jgi:hypothetical protein
LNQEQIERKKKMPVPILGHATLPRKTLKLVKSLIGQWGRCDMSNLNATHITAYLKELCPLITKEQLAESSAYALLLTVTKGETYNLVLSSMDSGVPFLQIWGLLYSFRPQRKTQAEISLELDRIIRE